MIQKNAKDHILLIPMRKLVYMGIGVSMCFVLVKREIL